MDDIRFLLVGSGGREAAFASLLRNRVIYCVMEHENPLIMNLSKRGGGECLIGSVLDAGKIADFAVKNRIDCAIVNSARPLKAGVVDELKRAGIPAFGATKKASRIEWDKEYAMRMVSNHSPDCMPKYEIVGSEAEATGAIESFKREGIEVVVKPRGLMDGRGVKVMGPHLKGYDDAEKYCRELVKGDGAVIAEKLVGREFTVMGFTNGKSLSCAPPTYDYPYRHDNDTGPGTGGMGCAIFKDNLPFLDAEDIKACESVMRKTLRSMRRGGNPLNGVLNGGFFKTIHGIKFMEYNARLGDPEFPALSLLIRSKFDSLAEGISADRLPDIKFKNEFSIARCLVHPEYPFSGKRVNFMLNAARMKLEGVVSYPADSIYLSDNKYAALGNTRSFTICASGNDLEDVRYRLNYSLKKHYGGGLEFRNDIGIVGSEL